MEGDKLPYSRRFLAETYRITGIILCGPGANIIVHMLSGHYDGGLHSFAEIPAFFMMFQLGVIMVQESYAMLSRWEKIYEPEREV